MKKLIALIAVIGFITVKSVSAQTTSQENVSKPATEVKAESKDAKAEMKSCHGHGSEAKATSSCCKNKAKASCCAKHEEKAELKQDQKDKTQGTRD